MGKRDEGVREMKNLDRFERMVDKVLERDGTIYHHEVTDLLRNEHAWMRRMVKAIQKMHIEHMDEWIVLDSVLKQLAQRRK